MRENAGNKTKVHRSIRFKLTASIAVVFIPVVVFMVINNLYAVNTVKKQAYTTSQKALGVLSDQVEEGLGKVDKALIKIWMEQTPRIESYAIDNEVDRLIQENEIRQQLAVQASDLVFTDGLFVFLAQDNFYISYISGDDGYVQDRKIDDYIQQFMDTIKIGGKGLPENWSYLKVGEEYYLFRILRYQDIFVGAWCNTETAIENLNTQNLLESKAVAFASRDGVVQSNDPLFQQENIQVGNLTKPYHVISGQRNYLVVGNEVKNMELYLFALVDVDVLLGGLQTFHKVILIILILLIVAILSIFRLFQSLFIHPLTQLQASMHRLRNGDLDAQVKISNTGDELSNVSQTFNSMASEIKNLKINVYEKTIEEQKAQLQYYHLQLNPHFFFNSLNTLHNLAGLKRYESIQELSGFLSEYYRFNVDNPHCVKLSEELRHTQNYIRIIGIRNAQMPLFSIQMDPRLNDAVVPSQSVLTFVGNSIKYAHKDGQETSIYFAAASEDRNGQAYLILRIWDEGKGFSQEVLQAIKEKRQYKTPFRARTGIYNLQKRLKLIYGGDAWLRCYNAAEGGAVAELGVPLRFEYLREENKSEGADC